MISRCNSLTRIFKLWFQVLLGARAFVQSSRTRGCCAFRSQVTSGSTPSRTDFHHRCFFYQSEIWKPHICIFLTRVSCSRCCQSYHVSLLQMLCQLLYSCLCLLSAASCSLVSATGLSQGPLCLYNDSSGPTWGVPLQPLPGRWDTLTQMFWTGFSGFLSLCPQTLGVMSKMFSL